jgi:hypothetical protein
MVQRWPQQPQTNAVPPAASSGQASSDVKATQVDLDSKALSEAKVEFTAVEDKSGQFYQLVDQFNASLNGKLDPYNRDRILKKLPPIAFRVVCLLQF